jgi:hypothetical protein
MTETLDTDKAPPIKKRGRRSNAETNKIRASLGLAVKVPPPKKSYDPPAILPEKTRARSQELLASMLQGRSSQVVAKIMDKALDDDDSDQMACLKILMDRVLPASYFEKDNKGSKGITIQIMGVGEVAIAESQEDTVSPIDTDYEEVTED